MHEIFYVDIYLILNFIINFFLLILTAVIRQKKGTAGRIIFVSLLFAALSAGTTYLFWNELTARVLIAMPELGAMVYAAYSPETLKDWCRDMGTFFSLTLFCGGGMTVCSSLENTLFSGIPISSIEMIGVSVVLMSIAFFLMRRQWARQRYRQQTMVWVELSHRGNSTASKALVDTGNCLTSPYTGEGVWIMSEKLAGEIGLSEKSLPVYIPYRSLGGNGMWEAYRLERALVDGKQSYENVLVAVSPHLGEMDEIQMILNIMRS